MNKHLFRSACCICVLVLVQAFFPLRALPEDGPVMLALIVFTRRALEVGNAMLVAGWLITFLFRHELEDALRPHARKGVRGAVRTEAPSGPSSGERDRLNKLH